MATEADVIAERALKYIRNAKTAVERLKSRLGQENDRRSISIDIESLIDAAERYVGDAEYYAAKGDYATALSAASYAEGLIDSLKYLGVLEPEWPDEGFEEKRVFVGGTFEILHPGHVELLRYASSLGKLYVVIARDSTVEKIKGRKPILGEKSRLKVVSAVRYVYNAFLGSEKDFLDSVEKVKPDIIVLGPDQGFDEEQLAAMVEARLGYRPEVVRFGYKLEFEQGIKGVRDIYREVCSRLCNSES
ncbi:putative cytidylyltransferase [Aeropyrum pernix K1]|uniref:Cytidylyltransferase n=1 Tax=Aeropyrum pernix (strain ATCC 700893 / DSM 11879 / JCM 9820 / NBRC 100138 / K1) TaxID=272557 RepID=Q9Y9K7_AERPE|nr:DUF357 domain-containing protein [Aeropyrum pernix]BAA81293.2 putative cytidylyltransferase [Aeropyrum pernix K1]